MCQARKIIECALSQVGYEEPNHDNHQKYGHDIDTLFPDFYNGKKDGYDWCTQFVAWVFLTVYGMDATLQLLNMPKHNLSAVVKYFYNYMMEGGLTSSTPHPGDVIFFQNSKGLSHVGIVVEVKDERVYTVEGNAGKGNYFVVKNNYSVFSSYIYGYGTPRYATSKYPDTPFVAINTLKGVAVRDIPYSDGNIIATIKQGATIKVEEMGGSSGDFARISGWVYLPGGFKWEGGKTT